MATFRNVVLKKEDFKGLTKDYPNEMELFLNTVNAMFTQLGTILNGGILFGDNISAQIKTIQVQSNQPYPIEIKSTLNKSPQGIIIINVTDKSGGDRPKNAQQAPSVDWTTNGQNIQIKSFPGLDPIKAYDLSILIF